MSTDKLEFDRPPCAALGTSVRQFAGDLRAGGLRFGLVVSRYNEALTTQLVVAATEALQAYGAAAADLAVAWVPGAYEIPLVVETWAAQRRFDALIALGCVIQGETPHAALINMAVAHGLAEIARRHGVPVIDCVVSANTEEQAVVRCRPGREGRGGYAACAAIEAARLQQRLARERT